MKTVKSKVIDEFEKVKIKKNKLNKVKVEEKFWLENEQFLQFLFNRLTELSTFDFVND